MKTLSIKSYVGKLSLKVLFCERSRSCIFMFTDETNNLVCLFFKHACHSNDLCFLINIKLNKQPIKQITKTKSIYTKVFYKWAIRMVPEKHLWLILNKKWWRPGNLMKFYQNYEIVVLIWYIDPLLWMYIFDMLKSSVYFINVF